MKSFKIFIFVLSSMSAPAALLAIIVLPFMAFWSIEAVGYLFTGFLLSLVARHVSGD